MDRVTSRPLRAFRGTSASAVTALLAAAAHTFGGAGAPSPLLVAVAAVLAAPIAVALVGRRPSVLRTSAAVAAAQTVFHGVFALFADTTAVVPSAGGMAGHAALRAAPVMTTMHAAGAHDTGTPMMAAHALAAIVTVALLHRGERMLLALGRGIRRLLPRAVELRTPQPAAEPLRRPTRRIAPRPHLWFVCALSWRGPPAVAA